MSTKEIQGKLWSHAPNNWAQHFEPWFTPMYKTVLKQLELNNQHSVLDAGCGSGLFSSMVIKTGAHVIGIDAASGLLDIARRRNRYHNFLEYDLETLPFANNYFDVVAAFNSLQYAGSFTNALTEAARVLKVDGRLIIGIWDKPEKSDATEILKSIAKLLPAPEPNQPGPFALSEDGKIEDCCKKCGLEVIHTMKIACPFLFSDLNTGVKSFMGTGPAAMALNINNKQIVEDTVSRALHTFKLIDDFYYLDNNFLVFIAEKK